MITLEQIEAEHSRVAAMIEAFRKQPLTTEYIVAGVKIPLAPGERYAGLVLGDDVFAHGITPSTGRRWCPGAWVAPEGTACGSTASAGWAAAARPAAGCSWWTPHPSVPTGQGERRGGLFTIKYIA